MTVKELIELLQTYPPNLIVITQRYSDYKKVTDDDFRVTTVEAINTGDEWLKRYWLLEREQPFKDDKELREHVKDESRKMTYLLIEGN